MLVRVLESSSSPLKSQTPSKICSESRSLDSHMSAAVAEKACRNARQNAIMRPHRASRPWACCTPTSTGEREQLSRTITSCGEGSTPATWPGRQPLMSGNHNARISKSGGKGRAHGMYPAVGTGSCDPCRHPSTGPPDLHVQVPSQSSSL